MTKIKLFSGTNNQKLSTKVASSLNVPLAKTEVVRFEDSEVRVRVLENVKEEVAVIIQSASAPTDTSFMELFFLCDALKRSEAKKIIGVLPYFGYARQNIQHREGEDVSVNVIIKFLETVGFSEIVAFDLHDEATAGIFSIPFKHLTALPLLAEEVKKYLKAPDEVLVVSPDQGGVERARIFSLAFFAKKDIPIGIVEKKRDLKKPHESQALELFGDVKNKTVVLVDDIITSGGTLLNAAELCLKNGAKKVLAAVVHHDFSQKAPKRIQESKIEKFFTTDTIELKDNQKFPKLQEISVAPLLVKEIKEIK